MPASKPQLTSPRAVIAADLDLLRPFAGTGVTTTMLFVRKHRFLRHSRFVGDWRDLPDPAAERERAVETLIDLARSLPERPVLYYADDPMLNLVHEHRERIEAHYRLLMPAGDVVRACGDKLAFWSLAQEAGVSVPRTVFGDAVKSFDDVADFGLPLVLKPSSHVGWFHSDAVALAGGRSRKVIVAEGRAEFETLLAATRRFTDRFVVQEFIPGGEEQVYSFHAFVGRDSIPLASFVGRKIRTNPMLGGESSYIALVRDFAISRLGKEIVQKLKLVGPVKIDIKRDPREGRDYVLEINLRFNLWHQLGAVCGVNLPLIAYQYLTGTPLEAPLDYRTDVRWLDIVADLRAFLSDYRPAGVYSFKRYVASLRAPKVYHLFAWKDPLPFLLGVFGMLKAATRRAFRRSSPASAPGNIEHVNPRRHVEANGKADHADA